MNFIIKIVALLGMSFTHAALASFDADDRSINGTGETLPKEHFELGLASGAYGIDDDLMILAPTLPLLSGLFEVGLRYKIPISSRLRLSPQGFIGSNVNSPGVIASAGLILGYDLTPDKRNYLAVGLSAHYSPKLVVYSYRNREDKVETHPVLFLQPSLEFDHYTDKGNLFYIGSDSLIPYVGFTWTFDQVHLGVVGSALNLFFPMPYVYVRF